MSETHKPFSGRFEERGLSISACPKGGFIVWQLGGGLGMMDMPIASFTSAADAAEWIGDALAEHEHSNICVPLAPAQTEEAR